LGCHSRIGGAKALGKSTSLTKKEGAWPKLIKYGCAVRGNAKGWSVMDDWGGSEHEKNIRNPGLISGKTCFSPGVIAAESTIGKNMREGN